MDFYGIWNFGGEKEVFDSFSKSPDDISRGAQTMIGKQSMRGFKKTRVAGEVRKKSHLQDDSIMSHDFIPG